MDKQLERQTELRLWQHGLIFFCVCALWVTKRPDAIFHAQFWAEDGRVFFGDAYNFGPWTALLRPNVGYFHAVPRLGASLALLFPLSLAPLVLNLIAIVIQALPVNILLLSRSSVWGSVRYRSLLAAIYLALPNSGELTAIITNSQCLLALSAFLLVVAATSQSVGGRIFDIFFLLLSGLSGPYCIFLLPIALFLAWKRCERWRWVSVGAIAASCLVQAWGLLIVSPSARPHYSLGASPSLLARILAGQVYVATLLGSNSLAARSGPWLSVLFFGVAIGGTAIIAICFVKSALEMKLFILLSSMVLAASLISPFVPPSAKASVWELLTRASGIHYWFFPTLAFAWSLLWCFHCRVVALKAASAVLLCLMCFGIALGWRYPAFKDLHFAEYARQFGAAPVGTAVTIPENPEGWNMRLVKHRPSQ